MTTPEEKQKYADKVRQLIPINELPPEVQNEILRNAAIINLKKKSLVFKQGDRDNYSFYLIEGEIQLEANKQVNNTISGSSSQANYPMAQLQPRQFSGIAKTDSVVIRIDRNSLDKLLVANQSQSGSADDFGDGFGNVEVDVIDGDEEESMDWMTRMLQSEIFASMPITNIHQLFALLEPIEYKAGDNVITQGESGQHYYIIQEGSCEVLRHTKPGMKEVKLAELKAGDGFGEEALITETTRNATIRMLTDGVVAQLSKDDFANLIQKATLKSVTSEKAEEIIAQGGKWLDVRFKNEHDLSTIEGSLHVPANILRLQAEKLDPDIHYVLFCDTGGRSSAASFLLADRGLNASYLEGGLMNHPELAPDTDVTHVPKPAPPVPEQKVAAPAVPPPKPKKSAETPPQSIPAPPVTTEETDEDIDPEIMETVLNAELTHNRMKIEQAKKQDQTDLQNQQTAKHLEAERAKIEEQKKRVAAQVQALRKQEAERLKQVEIKAEKRMEQERKKIEEVYSRNAEEMEKLEKMKQEAEEKMNAERERMEKQADEARKNKEDSDKIRQELEAARKAMEEEAQRRELEQEEMRKKIELEARKKIEIERRKLAEQFAKNNQEVEQARREKAIAEAARAAAKQEAELMIEEYKSQHDKSVEEQEQQIREERMKLEEEQKKIRAALEDIQRARAEAEAMKRSALGEIATLKAKQFQEDVTKSEVAKTALKDKIKDAQQKLAKASEKAAMVEKDEEQVVVAQQTNQEDLQRKKAQEEALARQLQADLAGFKEELEEQEREYASATTQLDHMKRIKERAESAKREASNANSDLLSDVSAQLDDKD